MSAVQTLVLARRLVSCDPAATTEANPLGASEHAAVHVDGERVVAVGPAAELRRRTERGVWRIVAHEGLVTPGLVDAHTHAAWVGSRAGEYVMRMAGAGYEAIAAAGGGIVASMRAVREAEPSALARVLGARLRRMAALGVTTVEVKSGYGLSEPAERKQLEAVARATEDAGMPRVVPTFLGLHALPPDGGDRARYAAACRGWLDGIARDELARFVDAYVDRAAFSVAEARPVLERALALGLGIRLHVGQFADVGGAALAAELGAASVDHLEHLGVDDASRLAERSVTAGMLPLASYTLGQQPPDIARLRAAGERLVVASNANPGSAPSESLPVALAFAARGHGLGPDEIVLGATRRAAASLRLAAGWLGPGAPADLVLWDLGHEHEQLRPWGVPRARQGWRSGRLIAPPA
jgi:imidazolonepropionase